MEKIILTGFEPFGPYPYNPTQKSTLDFDGKIFGDKEVLGLVLPCTYDSWSKLAGFILKTGASKIINTGLSSSVKGVRIETKFKNIMNGKYPDVNGYSPQNIPIIENDRAPEFVKSKAPNKKLFELLIENNIPSEISNDADSFICNSLGYKTSLAVRTSTYLTKNIFIRIPWTSEYEDKILLEQGKIFLETEKYYKALELLIRNI